MQLPSELADPLRPTSQSNVPNALRVLRPTLGDNAGAALYRLLRLFATETRLRVEVFECVTCSGLNPVGRVLYHFEGGRIAGSLTTIFKQKTRAVETKCIGGLGDEACSFDIERK
jgi:hypothetical protein